jgi:hypothetical protein
LWVSIDGAMSRNTESSLPERAMTAANTCGDMQRRVPGKGRAFVIAAVGGPDGNNASLKPCGSALKRPAPTALPRGSPTD